MKLKREKKEHQKAIAHYLKSTSKDQLRKNILRLLKIPSSNKNHNALNSSLKHICTENNLSKKALSKIEEYLYLQISKKSLRLYHKKIQDIYDWTESSEEFNKIFEYITDLQKKHQELNYKSMLIQIALGRNTVKKFAESQVWYPKNKTKNMTPSSWTTSSAIAVLKLFEENGYIIHTNDRPKKYIRTDKPFTGLKKKK